MRRITKRSIVKTTIPIELDEAIQKFRTSYMSQTGKYIDNSKVGRYLAKKIDKIKPSKEFLGGSFVF